MSAINDANGSSARIHCLEHELQRAREERDMYWEVYIAVKDVRDLGEMASCCPITKDQQVAAEESLDMTIREVEEWEMNL